MSNLRSNPSKRKGRSYKISRSPQESRMSLGESETVSVTHTRGTSGRAGHMLTGTPAARTRTPPLRPHRSANTVWSPRPGSPDNRRVRRYTPAPDADRPSPLASRAPPRQESTELRVLLSRMGNGRSPHVAHARALPRAPQSRCMLTLSDPSLCSASHAPLLCQPHMHPATKMRSSAGSPCSV